MCTENHLHFDYVRLAWDAGFCFEEYNTKNTFDISTIGLVDIDKVTRERDIATVERHIPTILQFRLDEELTRILEPTFVKIFKLCQLSLQYLRFCNKYLDNTVIILKKDLLTSNDENINLSNIIEQLKIENSNLNIKNKELREAFNNINQSVSFKCHECTKSFASEEYLHAHISRRHDSQSAQLQSESEKLQLEIKELKERLNSTEKYIQHEKEEPNNDAVFDDKEAVLQAKFEQLKEHIEKELSVLRDESFYRSMYEKWFEEIFQKLKYETPKKVYIEQGSGDCVQVTNSSTQTNIVEEVPNVIPRSVQKEEKSDGREEIEKIEQRLKVENIAQREIFEKLLEQKIVGSLGKLETQMNVFGRKLEDLELKKIENNNIDQEKAKTINEEKSKQPPTNINPIINKSRYIPPKPVTKIGNSSETESNSECENVPPKPAQRSLKPSLENKPIAPPRPPIRVASFNRQDSRLGIEKKKPIRVASFNRKDSSVEKSVAPMNKAGSTDKSSDSSVVSDDSVDIKVIKTVQKTSVPIKVESKSKPEIRKENKTVLKENVQRGAPKKLVDVIESSDENLPVVKPSKIASSKPVAYNEELLEGLKEELEEILNLRLKEIGVAPQWKGLPNKNYKHAIRVIDHQASLSSKSIPNYTKIRDEIVRSINKNIRKTKSELQQNKDSKKESKRKRKSKSTRFLSIRNRGMSTSNTRNDAEDSKNETVTIFENPNLTSSDLHSTSSDEIDRPPSSPERPGGKIAGKKKVLFNLKSEDSMQMSKVLPRDFAGSASSLGSSVLDRNDKDGEVADLTTKRRPEKEESDWDISDIVV